MTDLSTHIVATGGIHDVVKDDLRDVFYYTSGNEVYSFDQVTGTATLVFTGTNLINSIVVTHDDSSLIVGYDSTSMGDQYLAKVSLANPSSVTHWTHLGDIYGEYGVENLVITPDNQVVISAYGQWENVTSFSVDSGPGTLSSTNLPNVPLMYSPQLVASASGRYILMDDFGSYPAHALMYDTQTQTVLGQRWVDYGGQTADISEEKGLVLLSKQVFDLNMNSVAEISLPTGYNLVAAKFYDSGNDLVVWESDSNGNFSGVVLDTASWMPIGTVDTTGLNTGGFYFSGGITFSDDGRFLVMPALNFPDNNYYLPAVWSLWSIDLSVHMHTTQTGTDGADTLTGTVGQDALSGGGGDDVLAGLGGDDVLYGGEGNDDLVGGAGQDALYGDGGNDTLHYTTLDDRGDSFDGGAGTDTLVMDYGLLEGTFTNIERLYSTGGGNVYASIETLNAFQVLDAGNFQLLDGGTIDFGAKAGSDVTAVKVFASDEDTTVTGTAGNDELYGGNGNDVLYGGAGDDYIEAHYHLFTTATFSDTNQLHGGFGNDTLVGSDGNDFLYGEDDNDSLTGDKGNDLLDGGTGADTMTGGAGDDTYVVDNAGDVVSENSNEGTDTVQSSITYTLGGNFENLVLTGSANINGTGNGVDNVLTGNSGNNVLRGLGGNDTLDGGAGGDALYGGLGDDTFYVDNAADTVIEYNGQGTDTVHATVSFSLSGQFIENLILDGSDNLNATGNSLNNVITGNAGNNLIDGGYGADAMAGGAGDDTYIVDNAGDTVSETAGEGTDLVRSSVSFTLGANIENLMLTGTGNINGTGNNLNNLLVGNSGKNGLSGGAGDDTYVVDNAGDTVTENASEGTDLVKSSVSFMLGANIENLTLTGSGNTTATGNELNNVLTGNGGNNVLNGGIGADTMAGGAGNDTYYVDNAGDAVQEGLNQGTDLVMASVSFSLAGQQIENLTLTGTGNINGTGNSLANVLTGNSGNNVLDGGFGADTMKGGAGDDTYYVDNAGDVVQEGLNQGTDLVYASVSFSLAGQQIENLTLTGAGNLNATGNSLANVITGNNGNNVIDGGYGNDILWGKGGADTFLFGAASGADTIEDFSTAQGDSINVNAYSHGAVHAAWITQSGSDVLINLGGTNVITVLHSTVADVSAHMVW